MGENTPKSYEMGLSLCPYLCDFSVQKASLRLSAWNRVSHEHLIVERCPKREVW